MSIISDGTGTGKQARVDTLNRLEVHSTSFPESRDENSRGNAYNINTGELTLTSANASSVLYFKNNENYDYVIEAIAVGFGASTGGSGDAPKIVVVRNPTTGTVVSDATNVDINSNRNYGSQTTLSANVYKGGEGKTLTNGDNHIIFYQAANGRLFGTIEEILPKGSSIGVTITPMSGNTSMKCYVALIGYLRKENTL